MQRLCHLASFKNLAKAWDGTGIGWLENNHDVNLLPFYIVKGGLHYVYILPPPSPQQKKIKGMQRMYVM